MSDATPVDNKDKKPEPAANGTQKEGEIVAQLGALEEDDEFEEFGAEGVFSSDNYSIKC